MKLENELKWFFPTALALFAVLFVFAFFHAPIQADDAWLGQQVNSLIDSGEIHSSLFLDFPPLDGKIVVYHKLLVWTGGGICSILGWGLHQLRLVPVLCGLLTLLLIYFVSTRSDTLSVRKTAILILLCTPVFWNKQLLFRPDPMVMLCGFASFIILMRAREGIDLRLYILSGALAGLAGLAHPLGLAFAAAAFVLLLTERKFTQALFHLLTAVLFFLPYLSGWFSQPDLFTAQMFDNDLMLAKVPTKWWTPFLGILEEHKRLFRKPEIIGISVLLLLSLISMTREWYRRERPILIYTAVLIVVIAIPPFPKMTQYSVPLMPFFALIIARGLLTDHIKQASWKKTACKVRNVWSAILILFGVTSLVHSAFFEKDYLLDTNRRLASKMEEGAVVMAPLDFIFPNDDRFTIVSWRGINRAADDNKVPDFLEDYASKIDVEYILADSLQAEEWNLSQRQKGEAIGIYDLIYAIESPQRLLFGKHHSESLGDMNPSD